jgi:hypothetical protein
VAVLASEKGKDAAIDPRLKCIAREISKKDPKLDNFRLGRMTCRSVPVGEENKFTLVKDQAVTVTVDRGADEHHHMVLRVTAPGLREITYQTCCGKFLLIQTPYRADNNEVLFLAVRVQPCNGK